MLELEGLEGRCLLNGHMDDGRKPTIREVDVPGRVVQYATDAGARVRIGIEGKGLLTGTAVDPDGGLNLVYAGTNAASKIIIDVRGRGNAPLKTVRNASVAQGDVTGVGGQILGALLGPKVDLVDNGDVNLSSGIGRLQLRSVGRNTQLHLRELPQTVQPDAAGPTANISTGLTGTNSITLNSVSAPSSGINTGVARGSDFTASRPLPPGTQGVSAGSIATRIAPGTFSSAGRTLSYSNDEKGGSTLTGVSGLFVPTANLVVSPVATPPATPIAPPGVVVQVNQIVAGTPGRGTLGDGQVYGYDPVANTLIRFDTQTGEALQSIAVGGTASPSAGVGLSRVGRQQVVLLGRGSTVQAFNVSTGASVGQFRTASLVPLGINSVAGIAFAGTTTVLTDPNGQLVAGSADFGVSVPIDVAASLASGSAVASGRPFAVARGFELGGGSSGVAGLNNAFLIGGARFDAFQPNLNQVGVLAYNPAATIPREASRTALPGFVNAGPTGAARANPNQALGSVERLLARVSGLADGKNVVTLLAPSSLASQGTITLNSPNLLAGLSESFHPELAGSALFDIQGNVQSFNIGRGRGLALNDAGNLNIIKANELVDSTVFGQPVGHVSIRNRRNVTIVSSARSVDDRGGVVVDPAIRPLGPLSLPD